MKRFIYEIYYIDDDSYTIEYWESKNFHQAKKEIFEAYSTDYYKNECPCKITMIAEIKYEIRG